jgi:hypothetical protein
MLDLSFSVLMGNDGIPIQGTVPVLVQLTTHGGFTLYAQQLDHGRYLAVFMLVLLVDEFPWVYPLPPES